MQEFFMCYKRLSALLATATLGILLSGCVVAPLGPRSVGMYPGAVYVEPAPVVVVPAPGYYYGHRGHRYWR